MTGQTIQGAKVKRDLSKHPRVKRKKPQHEDWRDMFVEPGSPEEKYRRALLWDEFAKFVKGCGAWVVSLPDKGKVLIQLPRESAFLDLMARFPRYKTTKLPGNATRLAHGEFVPVDTVEVTLWRDNVQPPR